MTSKSIQKQIRIIKTTCKFLSEGTYGEVFIDRKKQFVYKIGDISRKEFDTSLKFYKLGIGPKPISIVGKGKNKIFKMEYIHGFLLTELSYKYYNDIIADFDWDYKILSKLINTLEFLHCNLGLAHNDLHSDNIIYDIKSESFKFLDLSCTSSFVEDILDEINDLIGTFPFPDQVDAIAIQASYKFLSDRTSLTKNELKENFRLFYNQVKKDMALHYES